MREPYPEDVAGEFYVESGCCSCCDVPIGEAPQLFRYTESSEYMHCYVAEQPKNDSDLSDMLTVINCAEFRCVRYRGNDPNILRRLNASGDGDSCDVCDVTPADQSA